MSHLVDTDILVEHLRQRPGAGEYLDSLGAWSYSIITAMELFAGADSKKEIQRLENFSEISERSICRRSSELKAARL